jgi:hypothetical protein
MLSYLSSISGDLAPSEQKKSRTDSQVDFPSISDMPYLNMYERNATVFIVHTSLCLAKILVRLACGQNV